MSDDITRNHALAAGLSRAAERLHALTEAGIAVRKIEIYNAEPAFMLGRDQEDSAGHPPARARRH